MWLTAAAKSIGTKYPEIKLYNVEEIHQDTDNHQNCIKKFRRTVITHLFFTIKIGLSNLGSYFRKIWIKLKIWGQINSRSCDHTFSEMHMARLPWLRLWHCILTALKSKFRRSPPLIRHCFIHKDLCKCSTLPVALNIILKIKFNLLLTKILEPNFLICKRSMTLESQGSLQRLCN